MTPLNHVPKWVMFSGIERYVCGRDVHDMCQSAVIHSFVLNEHLSDAPISTNRTCHPANCIIAYWTIAFEVPQIKSALIAILFLIN